MPNTPGKGIYNPWVLLIGGGLIGSVLHLGVERAFMEPSRVMKEVENVGRRLKTLEVFLVAKGVLPPEFLITDLSKQLQDAETRFASVPSLKGEEYAMLSIVSVDWRKGLLRAIDGDWRVTILPIQKGTTRLKDVSGKDLSWGSSVGTGWIIAVPKKDVQEKKSVVSLLVFQQPAGNALAESWAEKRKDHRKEESIP